MFVNLSNIPNGNIRRELEESAARTGWTPELLKAAERLPRILDMTPEEFERFSGSVYEVTT